MTSGGRYNLDRPVLTEIPVASVCPAFQSETWIDIALLASALFLQRFAFGKSAITFNMVAAGLIIAHQFASGRLLVQYDRLLWFLALGLAVTSSLLLNFDSRMLYSYSVFLAMYSLFTFSRPSTPDLYKSTLRGFQCLILILSSLGIVQFAAQFVIDGRQIILFFRLVPEFLLARDAQLGSNTIIPITQGSSLIKSNGVFLAEPSTMSQIAALGILIEVLEFRRPRYLFLLALGLLMSYSGTGITMLLVVLPLTALVDSRAQVPALLVAFFALTLIETGLIDLSAFTSRVDEFENTQASGFARFISSFWMTGEYLHIASPLALLCGNGPATMKYFNPHGFYLASGGTWFKVLYEYGLIGAFTFTCFLVSCFQRSRCPKPLILALFYDYLFTGDALLSMPLLTIMGVLCTLSGSQPRHVGIDEASHHRSSLVPGSSSKSRPSPRDRTYVVGCD